MRQLFLIYLLLINFTINAETITLTFTGKIENTIFPAKLDSIRIDNLSNNTSAVYINKSIISIYLGTTGIEENVIEAGISNIYPNPFSDELNFQYASPYEDKIIITVFNTTGQIVCNYSTFVNQGLHIFRFSSDKEGIYFIRINSKEYNYTTKAICLSNNKRAILLSYIGEKKTNAKIVFHKKLLKNYDLAVKKGDQLKFTGYSGKSINCIYDIAFTSKSYEFEFPTRRSFHFEKHLIQTSAPCFVDIMFSVKNDSSKGVDYLINKDFNVLEDNTSISPSETFRYVKKINQLPYKLKTVVMLDNSNSLANDINIIKTAAISFVQTIGKNQEIALYVFSDSPVLLQDFTSDITKLTNAINKISLGYASTNLYGSIITGLSRWTNTYNLDLITQGYLVVFTDGYDTQGTSTLPLVLNAKGNKKIYMIGKGNEIQPTILNQIASPSKYIPIDNINQLAQTFTLIQNDIIRLANSFYWLNYMTPKRASNHNLRLEAINNFNSNPDSYIDGQFSANGFKAVKSGVYVNVDYTYLYGLDTIICHFKNNGHFEFLNQKNQVLPGQDSLLLKAFTFWAHYPPVYKWTLDTLKYFQLKQNNLFDSKVYLFPFFNFNTSNIINIIDESNNYSNKIFIRITSDLPTVTTNVPSDFNYTTATCGGNVIDQGKTSITSRGVSWGTDSIQIIGSGNKTSDGSGTGKFISNITGLNDGTKYYVRAYATNSIGTSYGKAYSFTTIDNKSPAIPSNPIPSDGATGITSSTLTWQCSDPEGDQLIYDVYLGTTNNPTLTKSGLSSTNYTLGTLNSNTKYYWKVLAKDNYGNSTNGPVWSFTSAFINQAPSSPTNPNPIDGATNVASNAILSWTASTDPENEPIVYDVYFGTSSNLQLVQQNLTNRTYNTGILEISTIYYWKIVAKDNHSNSSNSTIWSFSTVNTGVFTDTRDNKVYKYAKIGTQTWMAENLNIGTKINSSSSQQNNSIIEKYCYNDDENNCNVYGGLYQWDEMMQYKPSDNGNVGTTQGICPLGWHLPTTAEWNTLFNFLGGTTLAGGKMKETGTSHWQSPNTSATNESGFSGLPAGSRNNTGSFINIGRYSSWWSATAYSNDVFDPSLYYGNGELLNWVCDKKAGLSARCIKN